MGVFFEKRKKSSKARRGLIMVLRDNYGAKNGPMYQIDRSENDKLKSASEKSIIITDSSSFTGKPNSITQIADTQRVINTANMEYTLTIIFMIVLEILLLDRYATYMKKDERRIVIFYDL